ncbi:hypothetical protein KAS08_04700 [Candidatus Pacearchaeota archaeon]|nr:hypothetical protein [Candidatus Pacearchaeota archaeon]
MKDNTKQLFLGFGLLLLGLIAITLGIITIIKGEFYMAHKITGPSNFTIAENKLSFFIVFISQLAAGVLSLFFSWSSFNQIRSNKK